MLQQTRVEAVLLPYTQFLQRFPDVRALAAAPVEAVLAAWSGLGYYRRARLLHQAAQHIMHHHGGAFPATRAGVLALPGIGRYTAGAILSLAFEQPEPVVDGNVERVFARWLAIPEEIKAARAQQRLWHLATAWVEQGCNEGYSPRALNQALMECGALLCTPRQPACACCPIQPYCAAYLAGNVAHYPQMPARKMRQERRYFCVFVRNAAGHVLLSCRPEEDRTSLLPAGLWEFPHVEWPPGCQQPPLVELQEQIGGMLTLVGNRAIRRHSIMDWRVQLVLQEACPAESLPSYGDNWRWFTPGESRAVAQSSATRKLLEVALGKLSDA
jgi:A/G-specific adenine glycosylase